MEGQRDGQTKRRTERKKKERKIIAGIEEIDRIER